MTRLIFSSFLVLLGGILAVAWQHIVRTADRMQVNTTSTTTIDLPEGQWIEGLGYVEPRTELRQLVFKTGGVIERLGPNVGDLVKKDETIAELDALTANAAFEIAQRKLDLARAKLVELKAGEHRYLIEVTEGAVERLRE